MEARGPPAAKNQGPFSGLRERVLRHSWSGHGWGGSSAATASSASSSSACHVTSLRDQWVETATDGECWNCRPDDWQRIVAEVRPSDCQWILQRIRERPVMTDHIVALKALVLLHRVLQQGPAEAATEWGFPNSLLDDLVSCWSHSQAQARKGSQQSHCMQVIVEYARLLSSKMELMVERDAGRGHFTGSIVFYGQFVDPSDLLQALAMLLNFAERLMPLTLNLVAPPQDWRRGDRSQYMTVYLAAILALLHEAWLLLCAVSLFVKNLLCIVHAQKQREDKSRRDKNSPAPPWLQLALHLLQAQPRFIWFHQSVCDLVAHCHQLRMTGFQELATCIPAVPSSLLNLFADIGELVKPDAKDALPRSNGSISNVSTTAGSTIPPHDPATPPSTWEPSALVIDALKTVDSIQPVADSHATHADSEFEPSSGTEERCDSDGLQGYHQVLKPSQQSRARVGKKVVSRSFHPFAQGYSLLDDDGEQLDPFSASRGGRPAHVASDLEDTGTDTSFTDFTSTGLHTEQAPFVASEGHSAKNSFVWPETPWGPAFESVEATPFDSLPTGPTFSTPLVREAAAGSVGPPSWAAAICRTNTNVGSSQSSSIQVPIGLHGLRNPPWPPVPGEQHALQSSARSRRPEDGVAFTTRTPGSGTRSLSVEVLGESSPSANQREGDNREGPVRRYSAMGTSLNPFEPLTRAKVATKVSSQAESSETSGNSTSYSYAPPAVSSGFGCNPFWDAPRDISDTNSERPEAVGAPPIRIELPGVRSRATHTPLQRGDVPSASPPGPGSRNLWQRMGVVAEISPSSNKSGNSSAFGVRGITPREAREMQGAPRTQSPPPALVASPAMIQRRTRQRQPSVENQQHDPVARRSSKGPSPFPQAAVFPAASMATQQPVGAAPNDWEVNPAELQLEEMVGSGTTAEVHRGSWHGTDVAVKKLRQAGPLSTEFTRELSVLLRLRHPNLVLFMGASLQAPPMIISEYCDGGTVFALLHQRPSQGMPWSQRLKIALDVAKGMNFLHRRDVVHRDLKSLNLLLASPVLCAQDIAAVKVSDFGLSRISSADAKDQKLQACMTSGAGTYHWMAPEVLDGQKYDEKVDVYSYGICLFELLARRIPYDGSGLEPVSIAVAVSKGRRPDVSCIPQNCPADLRFTMECCWSHSPDSRPGFDTILETLKLVHSP